MCVDSLSAVRWMMEHFGGVGHLVTGLSSCSGRIWFNIHDTSSATLVHSSPPRSVCPLFYGIYNLLQSRNTPTIGEHPTSVCVPCYMKRLIKLQTDLLRWREAGCFGCNPFTSSFWCAAATMWWRTTSARRSQTSQLFYWRCCRTGYK